jgi:hypothetical protein
MISFIINVILLVLLGVMGYIIYNQDKKVTLYEDTLERYYFLTEQTLRTMREIDEREMFEKDDEVGDVFIQLVDTLNELRPIIYGIPNDDTET